MCHNSGWLYATLCLSMLLLQIHRGNQCVPPRAVVYMSRLWLCRSWKLTPSCGHQDSRNLAIKSRISKASMTTRKTKKKEVQFSPTSSFTEGTGNSSIVLKPICRKSMPFSGQARTKIIPSVLLFSSGWRTNLWWMGNSVRSCSRRKYVIWLRWTQKGVLASRH